MAEGGIATDRGEHSSIHPSIHDTDWKRRSSPVPLKDGDIHLWRVHVPSVGEWLPLLQSTLWPEERLRAERLRRPASRSAFIVGRGSLRFILSMHLSTPADQLKLLTTAYGRPFLEEAPGLPSLFFNVSHSMDWIVLAFGRTPFIGVDLEYIQEDFRSIEIARRFFTREEASLVESAPEPQRVFFPIWVRKEAYLKAIGKGLSGSLQGFQVPVDPGAAVIPQGHVSLETGLSKEVDWLFYGFSVDPAYASALVTSPPAQSIHLFDWATEMRISDLRS